MRRFLLLILVLVLAAALGGCSSDDPWNPGTPDIPRTNLYVANLSAERITAVHVVAEGFGDWGENWLKTAISGGDWYAYIGNMISGNYDIRMVGDFHTVEMFGFAVVSDEIAVTFNPGP